MGEGGRDRAFAKAFIHDPQGQRLVRATLQAWPQLWVVYLRFSLLPLSSALSAEIAASDTVTPPLLSPASVAWPFAATATCAPCVPAALKLARTLWWLPFRLTLWYRTDTRVGPRALDIKSKYALGRSIRRDSVLFEPPKFCQLTAPTQG
jgi:hypothetical protein